MFNLFTVLSARSISTNNERLALACASSSLQDGSTIVEVGSAFGGSAYIFTEAAPTSSLYCIDVADTLDDSSVSRSVLFFFRGTSSDFFEKHATLEIDLLFIDGDHYFDGVLLDFFALAPLVKENGLILFHDVDFVHPGVYTFVETLKRIWPSCEYQQVDKLCILKKCGEIPNITVEDYVATLDIMALTYGKIADCPHDLLGFTSALFNKKSFYIGRGSRGKLGSQFLGLNFDEFIDSNQVLDRDGKYFIFSAFSQTIRDFLISKKCISPENIFLFTDTILAYYIRDDILKNNCMTINSICRTEMNRDIFRKFISSQINNFSYKLSCSNFLAHLITHDFM